MAQMKIKVGKKEGYIYKIITPDGYCYIGQTIQQGYRRISQHLNNAYHNLKSSGASSRIYNHMRKYRICDLKIYIYKAKNDYGIPDFLALMKEFLLDWTPIDLSIKPIDFAEIFHILSTYNRIGDKLVNSQMGGRVNGFMPTVGGKIGNVKSKVLLNTDSPKQALQIIKLGTQKAKILNEEVRKLYDLVFSDKVADYEKKYGPVACQTWSDFLTQSIVNSIINGILNINGAKINYNQAKTNLKTSIDSFLRAKKTLMEDILEERFGKVKIYFPKSNNLDIGNLSEYVVNSIFNIINSENRRTFSKRKEPITKMDAQRNAKDKIWNFTPVNLTGIWKLYTPRVYDVNNLFLRPIIISDTEIEENFLKKSGVNLFEYYFKKAEKWEDLTDRIENRIRPNKDINVILVSKLFTPDNSTRATESYWLSTKMRKKYQVFAPGYLQDWYAFYRPMVACWRKLKRKLREFEIIESPGTKEKFTGRKTDVGDNVYLAYDTKIFVFNQALEELKIY